MWLATLLLPLVATAQFNPDNPPEPGTYRLTTVASPTEGGSTSPSSKDVRPGTKLTLSCSARSNYVFECWKDDDGNIVSDTREWVLTMPMANVRYTAVFKFSPGNPADPSTPPAYASLTAECDPAGGGTVSGTGRYEVGASRQLNASPNNGYTFVNWTRDGQVVGESRTLKCTVEQGTNHYVAHFVFDPSNPGEPSTPPDIHRLTLKCNPAGSASVSYSGNGLVESGKSVNVYASPNNGWRFVNWTDDTGAEVSTQASFTYTMPSRQVTLTANLIYSPSNPGEPSAPDATRDIIYGAREVIIPGSSAVFTISLENINEITGLNVDITHPEGINLDIEGATLTGRSNGHTLTMEKIDDVTTRLYVRGSLPFTGVNGPVIRMIATAPADAEVGTRIPVKLTRGVAFAADGSGRPINAIEGTMQVIASPESMPDSPDFVVTSLGVDNAEIMPGDMLSVRWIVENKGTVPAMAGWSELIYLTDADSRRVTLGTLHYDDTMIAAGSRISRSANLMVPMLPGMSGKLDVGVTLIPDVLSGEIEQLQDNNTTVTDNQPVTLGRCLRLEMPQTLAEGTDGVTRGIISRSGSWKNDETFALIVTPADTRLSIPATVTIPANQSGAYFTILFADNDELDPVTSVSVAVSGNGYDEVLAGMRLVDDEFPAIALSLSKEEIDEGETVALTVDLPYTASVDTEVKLSCDAPQRVNIPKSVVVKAGTSSAVVDITAPDNKKIDGNTEITIAARAPHYADGEAYLTVYDDDIPTLTLTLTPSEVSEGDGPSAVVARIARTDKFDSAVTIQITDDSHGEIFYHTGKIQLAANQESVEFPIGIIDNNTVDGNREITIEAAVYISSCGCATNGVNGGVVSGKLTILDNDGPTLSVYSSQSTILEGDNGGITVTVKRNTDNSEPLSVDLSSDADDILEYPSKVIIRAGSNSASFNVKAKANDVSEDNRVVNITATAEGYTKGVLYAMITDTTLPDVKITDISLPADSFVIGEADATVSLTLANTGTVELPAMVKTVIYIDEEIAGYVYNQEPVAAGSSVTLTKKVALPASVGRHNVRATANSDRKVKEISYVNNSSATATFDMKSPYTATVKVDKDVYIPGDVVTVTGSLTGNVHQGQEVEVYLVNSGARQTVQAVVDADGKFAATFTPYASQIGHFAAGACYPGEKLTTEMASFDILGINVTTNMREGHEIGLGEKYTGEIRIVNPCSTVLTGLKAETVELPGGCELKCELPSELGPGEESGLHYTLSSSELSEGNVWQQAKIKVTSRENASQPLTILYYVRSQGGALVSDLHTLDTSIAWGEVTEYPFVIRNIGKGASGRITLALPDWMDTATPSGLPSLAPGDSATVVLRLATNDKMKLNMPVTGQFGVNCANGNGMAISYKVVPVTDKTGTVVFKACDEYTYNTAEAPMVADATVKIFSPSTGELLSEYVTGADGTVSVEMKGGYYRCEVTATKHDVFSSYFFVNAGRTETVTADISYNPISISWNVVETEVEDEYGIEMVVDYETNVPMPVVKMILPKSIDGDNMAVGDATLITMTLVNVGLIKATNLNIILEKENPEWRFEQLEYTEPFDLDPQQAVNIPIRITRYADLSQQPHQIKANGPLETMHDTFSACMTHVAETYEIMCGEKLKNNIHAENMALKMCATSATMTAILESLSKITGAGGPGLPDINWYGPSSEMDPPQEVISICDPCDAKKAERAIDSLIGFSWLARFWDIINTALGLYRAEGRDVKLVVKDLGDNFADYAREGIKDGLCNLPDNYGKLGMVAVTIVEIISPCEDENDPDNPDNNEGQKSPRRESEKGWMEEFNQIASIFVDDIITVDEILRMFLGDEVWYTEMDAEKSSFMDWVMTLPMGVTVSEEEVASRRPSSVTYEQALLFALRMTGQLDDLSVEEVEAKFSIFEQGQNQAQDHGFANMVDYYQAAFEDYRGHFEEMRSSSVCASISLGVSQTMTMTRQAFEGTLRVYNGHESLPMKDVQLNLVIRDEYGNVATSHEFEIVPKQLDGFTGNLELPGDWSLGAGEIGTAMITFIPTRYAAPEEPRVYSFGGSITYIDPFTDMAVTRSLYPVELVVKPSPTLDLTYFVQRDVYADDPLTPDVIERVAPAEFALVINNKGYGDASNVRIVTQQPQIIDNEKGLLIDFEFVSSQLNGEDAVLALGGEMASDLGTISANSTAYAQWWLKSSLLGHFVGYDVTATHVNSYDNPDLTLLDQVTIHELIRGFSPDADAVKPVRAFLVNDITDADDAPDRIYFSNGDADVAVYVAASAQMTKVDELEYEVTIAPAAQGWNYASTGDLAAGRVLTRVVRKADGKEMPSDNFWQTEVTLRDGKEPLHEDRIHVIADIDAATTFVLTFEAVPEHVLDVEAIAGLPDQETTLDGALERVTVTFNKPVNAATFTTDDISLTLMGGEVDCSALTLTQVSDRVFNINFGKATEKTGYYVMILKVTGIVDTEGYPGGNDRVVSWSQSTPDGVADIVNGEGITMYPLPMQDMVYISSSEDTIDSVEFYDSNGIRRLACRDIAPYQPVDVSDLLPDVYIVRISAGGNVRILKARKK